MNLIADAVLLDARQDVSSALAKVIRSRLDRVAVRRSEGIVVFWYAFETQYVLERLRGIDGKASVKQALDLHERDAAPAQEIGTVGAAPVSTVTVVLDGSRFVGVCPATPLSSPDLQELHDLKVTRPAESAAPHPTVPSTSLEQHMDRGSPRKDEYLKVYRIEGPAEDGRSTVGFPFPRRAEPSAGGAPVIAPPVPEVSTAFRAYPRLDAPVMVSSREQFTITIGLASQARPGTAGGHLAINLPSNVTRFTLDVLVVAEGFDMPEGGRHRLEVDRADPYSHPIRVPLVAPESVDEPLLTSISVIYFFEKVPCGTGARRIAVIAAGTQPFGDTRGIGELWTSGDKPGGVVTVRPGVPAVDLTVTISKPDRNPASGQFVWTFESPHAVALPALPVTKNLGMDTQELGTHIIEGIQNGEAIGMVALEVGGLGKDIADRMPTEFWQLLREVAKMVNKGTNAHPPTVLFLTAEAHVPWELALVEPPLDGGAPPYLGCQTVMARWPLSDSGSPALPPEASIEVHQIAVVVGDYAGLSGWRKLEKAESEGSAIESRYGAIKISADPQQIRSLLYAILLPKHGLPTGTEMVHFACHGEATSGHVLDAAIILGQGQRMSPTLLANAPLGKQYRPFLFLNACQVGKAGELLGSFSGFAGESLKGGFRGFLAPLWSVDDGLAHDIALEFYERVFGSGEKPPEPVASVLRDVRRRFAPDTEKNSSTRLAYVFYGHPCLTISRIKEN